MLTNIRQDLKGVYKSFHDAVDWTSEKIQKKREKIDDSLVQEKFEKKVSQLSTFIQKHLKPEEQLAKQIHFSTKMAGKAKLESREFIQSLKRIKLKKKGRLHQKKALQALARITTIHSNAAPLVFATPSSTPLNKSLIEKLPRIKKSIWPYLEELKSLAAASPTGSYHIKKRAITKGEKIINKKYGLTVTKDGKVFVHIPGSAFAEGGSRTVKIAVDLSNYDIIARGVLNKSDTGLRNISGDLLVLECPDCENLGKAYAVTNLTQEDNISKNAVLLKYYSGGDLEGKSFYGDEFIRFALGIARGVEAIHDTGLAHRDLKPSNIMLDNGIPIVVDFDKVMQINQDWSYTNDDELKFMTRDVGTAAFSPPECQKESWDNPISDFEKNHPLEFMQKKDIYSLGLIYFLLRLPEDMSYRDRMVLLIKQASKNEFSLLQNSTDQIDQFIGRMLHQNPENRPTIDEVISFFENQQNKPKSAMEDIL